MAKARARWEVARVPEGRRLQLRARNGVIVLSSRPRGSRAALVGVFGAVIEASAGLVRRDPSKCQTALAKLPEVEG